MAVTNMSGDVKTSLLSPRLSTSGDSLGNLRVLKYPKNEREKREEYMVHIKVETRTQTSGVEEQ